uniref:Uncharacterized protein n=1 Tax=Panagrolaimus superbus TaxID=310955 RepID=A0A914YYS6_9BILA
MNIDTTFASYGLDENILIQSSMASYSSNYSFQLDDNNDDPRKSLMAFSKNRTLLMGSQRKSSEEIEKRLITANGAAMQYYKNEMLKRGDQ